MVQLKIKEGIRRSHFIVVNVKSILGMVYLVSECTKSENYRWKVNSKIDLTMFNEI